MKIRLYIVFAILLIGLPALNLADDAQDKSIKRVMAQWPQLGKALTPFSLSCLSFSSSPDSEVASAIDVDVREKHDATCGGDPLTAPLVATFRVKGRHIFILDRDSDHYVLWNTGNAKK